MTEHNNVQERRDKDGRMEGWKSEGVVETLEGSE
jgi:hypothetical protein